MAPSSPPPFALESFRYSSKAAPTSNFSSILVAPGRRRGKRPRLQMAPDTVVAWGLYAANCSDVESFMQACIGCKDAAHAHSIVIVDELPAPCGGVTHSFPTSQLLRAPVPKKRSQMAAEPLSSSVGRVGSSAGGVGSSARRVASILNWQKTRTLLRLLTVIYPLAE